MTNYIYCSRIDELSSELLYSQRDYLDRDQRILFDRFRFDDDKRRSLLGRMLLRYALKKHVGYQGSHFPRLHYNRYGKPAVMGMKGGLIFPMRGTGPYVPILRRGISALMWKKESPLTYVTTRMCLPLRSLHNSFRGKALISFVCGR